VPYVLDPDEKRQLIDALATELTGDPPVDHAMQILTRALAPELDAHLRAMYAEGRTYNRIHTVNVRLIGTQGLQVTIAAALAADMMAHDATMTTTAAILAAVLDRVRILRDDELEVFDVLRRLSFGKIYRVWVNEDELIELLAGDDPEEAKRTLARMKSRGILEEGAGKWRAVW
jgi:hypothetical protein